MMAESLLYTEITLDFVVPVQGFLKKRRRVLAQGYNWFEGIGLKVLCQNSVPQVLYLTPALFFSRALGSRFCHMANFAFRQKNVCSMEALHRIVSYQS